MWVANDGAGTIARIDPRTNRVTRRIRLTPGVFEVEGLDVFVRPDLCVARLAARS